MNRIIKFRGLNIETKKFVYGNLIHGQRFGKPLESASGKFIREEDISTEDIVTFFDCGRISFKVTLIQIIEGSESQFTGSLDCNGKEVFEGDIVKILYTDWPSQCKETNGRYAMSLDQYKDSISNIGIIIFKNSEFLIQFNNDGDTGSIYPGRHGQISAIGNIFEHSDLLIY